MLGRVSKVRGKNEATLGLELQLELKLALEEVVVVGRGVHCEC